MCVVNGRGALAAGAAPDGAQARPVVDLRELHQAEVRGFELVAHVIDDEIAHRVERVVGHDVDGQCEVAQPFSERGHALCHGVPPDDVVFGATYVTLTTVVFLWSVRLHPEHPAAAVAFGFLAIAAGQAVAAPIVGAIADHVSVTAAFTACAVLSATSPFVLSPRTDQQHTVMDRDAEAIE